MHGSEARYQRAYHITDVQSNHERIIKKRRQYALCVTLNTNF